MIEILLFAIFGLFIWIAYTDIKERKIENKQVLAVFFLAVLLGAVTKQISFEDRVMGFFSVSVPLLLCSLVIPGAFGGGDIKLMAAIGTLLGGKKVWLAFYAGIVMAAVYIGVRLVFRKVERKEEIPMGPFLVLGAIFVIVYR